MCSDAKTNRTPGPDQQGACVLGETSNASNHLPAVCAQPADPHLSGGSSHNFKETFSHPFFMSYLFPCSTTSSLETRPGCPYSVLHSQRVAHSRCSRNSRCLGGHMSPGREGAGQSSECFESTVRIDVSLGQGSCMREKAEGAKDGRGLWG